MQNPLFVFISLEQVLRLNTFAPHINQGSLVGFWRTTENIVGIIGCAQCLCHIITKSPFTIAALFRIWEFARGSR